MRRCTARFLWRIPSRPPPQPSGNPNCWATAAGCLLSVEWLPESTILRRVRTRVWRRFARNIEPLICALGGLLGAQKLSAESVMVASWDFVLKIGVEVNKLGGWYLGIFSHFVRYGGSGFWSTSGANFTKSVYE